jgi:hypothetical protein
MAQGSRLALIRSRLHGPTGVPAIAAATNLLVIADQIVGGCKFPINSFDNLLAQFGGAGAQIVFKGRLVALALAKSHLDAGWFPLQNEDDLINKLVDRFNSNYIRPLPAAVTSSSSFPLANMPTPVVERMVQQLSKKVSYPITSFDQINAAVGWRSRPELATSRHIGTHVFEGYAWNMEVLEAAVPKSIFPLNSAQDVIAKISDLQKR